MKMNMPVCGDNTVLFRATLFCLVRASLHMTPKDKKCFRDSSFRKIIRRLWPNTHQKTLDVILPEQSVLSAQQITIGKIYAAKLIYESFKDMKRRRKGNFVSESEEKGPARQKRGASILRRVMGAFRTSSNPLRSLELEEKKYGPSQEYLTRRRRSRSFDGFPISSMRSPVPRDRSSSVTSSKRHKWRRGPPKFKINIKSDEDSESDSIHYPSLEDDDDLLNQSTSSKTTQVTDITDINPIIVSTGSQDQPGSSAIADSLLTALRDPAKPILCFVNPQIHRGVSSDLGSGTGHPVERSHSAPRSQSKIRPSTFTVSLPMIRLEIPVENDSDMLNVPFHRASSDNNRSPTSEVIPDLIQSTGAHWSGTNGMSSKSPSPATSVRSSSSSENCSSGSLSDKGQQLGSDSDEAINETSEAGVAGATAMAAASNRASDKNVEMEILRTLNDQINRAVRQGGKSYLYEVRENDDETWC